MIKSDIKTIPIDFRIEHKNSHFQIETDGSAIGLFYDENHLQTIEKSEISALIELLRAVS